MTVAGTSQLNAADVQTVADLSEHMDRLRESAISFQRDFLTGERGFFTPSEDDQVLALWVSYNKSRAALHELINSVRRRIGRPSGEHIGEFAIAYAAALILIDAAQCLRGLFGDDPLVRRKLNESHTSYGIAQGSFDAIQLSLTDPSNALAIREARQFYDQHQKILGQQAQTNEQLRRVLRVIEARNESAQVSTTRYVKARVADRKRDARDRILVGSVIAAVYKIQEWGSRLVSNVKTMPGHVPRLPDTIQAALREHLVPGDVMATRKENALTNYFLPGYWPHVAMYVGDDQVVESLKDGVRERSMESPFGNDAVAVIRPKLDSNSVTQAIQRARTHIGKPYDFDFDFTRADRMVCTEVVYRSYEGIGGFQFDLIRRAGRQTISAEDLLQLAMRKRQFETVAVYCAKFSDELLTGNEVHDVLSQTVAISSTD